MLTCQNLNPAWASPFALFEHYTNLPALMKITQPRWLFQFETWSQTWDQHSEILLMFSISKLAFPIPKILSYFSTLFNIPHFHCQLIFPHPINSSVFLFDLSEAFDTVDHSLFWNIPLSFCNITLTWFSSCLTDYSSSVSCWFFMSPTSK